MKNTSMLLQGDLKFFHLTLGGSRETLPATLHVPHAGHPLNVDVMNSIH